MELLQNVTILGNCHPGGPSTLSHWSKVAVSCVRVRRSNRIDYSVKGYADKSDNK